MAVTFVKSLLDFKANCVKVVEGRPIVSRCVKMWPSETSFGQYIELALGLGMDEPQCVTVADLEGGRAGSGPPPLWATDRRRYGTPNKSTRWCIMATPSSVNL